MIGKLLGIGKAAKEVGEAVGGVAEVFVGNRAERDAAELERFGRVIAQYGDEFGTSRGGLFDGFVNGLNRLPRPAMALGTLGLFSYAMLDPHAFATRMQGLAYIPEPLWWLLGAVVSFYFGARELHHYRGRKMDLLVSPQLPEPRGESILPSVSTNSAALPARRNSLRVEPEASNMPAALKTNLAPKDERSFSAPAVAEPDFNAAFEEWQIRRV